MAVDVYRPPRDFRKIPEQVNLAQEVLRLANAPGTIHRVALAHERGEMLYLDLAQSVERFAAGLGRLGITRGMPVLIRMPNCREFAIAFLALTRIGAIPVLQNSLATSDELGYVLANSEAAAAITLAAVAGAVRGHAARLPRGLIVARGAAKGEYAFEDLLGTKTNGVAGFAATGANEPAFLVYTSGTTGKPKGIMHAHRWIIALGDSNRLRLPSLPDDVILSTGEWSFIAALGQNLLFPLRNGVRAAILEGRATPERVLEAIERYRVTLLYSVATVYRRLLAIEGFETRHDMTSLRGCNSTGEPLEKATYDEWKRRVGCDIWEHYGISEMQMVFGQGPLLPLRPGSVGIPLPGTDIGILDDHYRPVAAGAVANLLIRADNPGFCLGYYKNPELTAQVFRDGWYHTGDLAWQDEDGYVWIAGRSDDCFKSRGIFISPVEIENALRGHPAVAEACVVPRLDPEIGNRIRAVVVARSSSEQGRPLEDELRDFLRDRIAPFKIPHLIELANELPKNAVGKVLRRIVRES